MREHSTFAEEPAVLLIERPRTTSALRKALVQQNVQADGWPRLVLSTELRGTWHLRSRIDVTKDGRRHPDPLLGEDPIALLVYDDTGHFAAQFMKRDRASAPMLSAPPDAKNNTQAQGGYDAYFGTYFVDDATGMVTQRLTGSLSPGNVGMVLTRAMEVIHDTLRIQLETTAADGTPVTRTLTWERATRAR